jgi:3',5'-cyclic AMP phosphodiesterase CpdA
MRLRLAPALAAALLVYTPADSGAQAPVARQATGADAAVELLGGLPPALRDAGSAVVGVADERVRAKLVGELAGERPADSMDFLISLLEVESSPGVRAEIVDRLGTHRHPKVRLALERRLERDAERSDLVAGLAFKRLVREQGYSPPGGLSLGRLKEEGAPVRVLVFGDFGTGSRAQHRVAADMLTFHRERPFDLGLTVGDNFYPDGLNSPVHPRWQSQWEALYTPLGIEFYAILGNHDLHDPLSPPAQVLRTKRSASWRMPATYYTFTAGPVQFFGVDTNKERLTDEQLGWLVNELKRSGARWKVVYGHHPVKSDGEHGDAPYTARLHGTLLPRLREGGADVYIAGHDHDMQAIKPEGGLHLFVSGVGGRGARSLGRANHRLWGASANGFTVIEADAERLDVIFVGPGGERLYTSRLTKGDRP